MCCSVFATSSSSVSPVTVVPQGQSICLATVLLSSRPSYLNGPNPKRGRA
jgi:hypothetical protein